MQTDLNGKVAISVKAILKGTLLSFGAILFFSLVIAAYLLITNTPTFPEKWIFYLGLVSAALGGGQGARKAKVKGWLHGFLVGLLFLLVGYLLFGVEKGFSGLNWLKILVTLVGSSIGGMFGMLFTS